jgi:predicted alpha/beta-hydrolase family hydrolase
MFVLGHGSGAGMRHPGMEALTNALAAVGIATLRFNFPYMTAGRRIPDRAPKLLTAISEAVELGIEAAD